MELFISIILIVILLQTSYMVYRLTNKTNNAKGEVLLDTSVLIDGRILAIARSGLISSRLIVPRSVVRELQFMADKADHDKRERARYGLEVIEKLQELPTLTMEVVDDGTTSEHGVDEQLIVLARRTGAKLCTIDYNLNKAARVQDVEIININELAHALRVVHLPGEKIDVELVQPGQDKKQAVGYLDDGTMVVVDDARELIGQTVGVEITRALQTTAGRMMFAKRISAKKSSHDVSRHAKTTESSVLQTPGDGKARRQMITEPSATNTIEPSLAVPSEAVSTSSPKTNRRAPNPRNPRGRSNTRKPRSAEDTLVTLANKE